MFQRRNGWCTFGVGPVQWLQSAAPDCKLQKTLTPSLPRRQSSGQKIHTSRWWVFPLQVSTDHNVNASQIQPPFEVEPVSSSRQSQRSKSRGGTRSRTLATRAPLPSPLQIWTFADFSESPHTYPSSIWTSPQSCLVLPAFSCASDLCFFPIHRPTLGVYGPRLCLRPATPSSDIASHGCCGCFLRVAQTVAYQCSPWDHPSSSSLLAGPNILSVPARLQADPAPLPQFRTSCTFGRLCVGRACLSKIFL